MAAFGIISEIVYFKKSLKLISKVVCQCPNKSIKETQFINKMITIKPLLAHSFDKNKLNPKNWWLSEKLDGVRCVAQGGKLFTRTGKPINAPASFLKDIPVGYIFDGELYGTRSNFDKVSGIARQKFPVEKNWKALSYRLFDIVDLKKPFEERQELLNKLIPAEHAHLKVVEQTLCKGQSHLDSMLKTIEEGGGEGLMLRQAKSLYVCSRSKTLLKVKSFKDIDARVVEHEIGKGRNKRRLGALVCVLPNKKRFKVGSGFSDAQREKPPKVGSLITIKYFEMTKRGVPRFPTYVGARAEQDM
jgi:DNA ligase-1